MAVSFGGTQCIKFSSQGDSLSGRYWVSYVRWVGATTSGHKAKINDGAGQTYFDSEADGANFLDIMPVFHPRDGITIASLGSGTLYVYTL